MNVGTLLKLGRVSNLPTVWTNAFAGVALAGTWPPDGRIVPILIAMTLAYTGGMFLNDAFDRDIDQRERPERPIPAGEIGYRTVLQLGFGMLGVAWLLIAGVALGAGDSSPLAIPSGLALMLAIVVYDRWHKGNPYGPLVMGLCRMLVYLTAGLSVTSNPSPFLFIGAVVLLAYLIGLTYTAKQESLGRVENLWPLALLGAPLLFGIVVIVILTSVHAASAMPLISIINMTVPILLNTLLLAVWLAYALQRVRRRAPGDIPAAVGAMIAGIALVDAVFLAAAAGLAPALLAVCGAALTLLLQRRIAGT